MFFLQIGGTASFLFLPMARKSLTVLNKRLAHITLQIYYQIHITQHRSLFFYIPSRKCLSSSFSSSIENYISSAFISLFPQNSLGNLFTLLLVEINKHQQPPSSKAVERTKQEESSHAKETSSIKRTQQHTYCTHCKQSII